MRYKFLKCLSVVAIMFLVMFSFPFYSEAAMAEDGTLIITSMPKIREYCVGDTLSTKGLSLAIQYNSGEVEPISGNYNTEYDFSLPGERLVTVSYTKDDKEYRTSFAAMVYEKPILYSENVTVKEGEQFTIPVYISKNCGIMGIQIEIAYDKDCFTPVEVIECNYFSNGSVNDSIETSKDNTFNVIWTGSEKISENGKMFSIKFTCKKRPSNATSNIVIRSQKTGTYNQNYADINCEAGQSIVTVSEASQNGPEVPQNPEEQIISKKPLENLVVTMADWKEDNKASSPKLQGNLGNGEVTYYYSTKPNSGYTTAKPSKVGKYYLKVVVEETEQYACGITTCSFKISSADIKSKKPVISSIKNIKGKKLQLRLAKKIPKATGYQIKYSLKSNMKGSKKKSIAGKSLSIVLKSLKKKTYYIQIRAYEKVGKRIYYSKWSNKVKCKVKK